MSKPKLSHNTISQPITQQHLDDLIVILSHLDFESDLYNSLKVTWMHLTLALKGDTV